MIKVDLAALIGRLNTFCRHSLEEASSLCISHHDPEVTVAHFLYKLIENPYSDVRTILEKANLDIEELNQHLSASFGISDSLTDQYPSFSPLLIDVLQEAWGIGSLELGESNIRSGAVLLAILMNASRYTSLDVVRYFGDINREALRKEFHQILTSSAESDTEVDDKAAPTKNIVDAETPLEKYGTNFTALAQEGKIDPVLCRDEEIDLMIDILSRRRKNNPIAVGDPGVGKSALIEGLALRIHEGKAPSTFTDIELWGLDLGALQAGASVKGEFEKRLKSVIEFVKNSAIPIIIFIDEAHTMIGAGNQAGGGDAANLLKPALARGELRTIAATTWTEYKKYFEKDPALARRFQLVKLDEPSVEDSVHILRGLRPAYEDSHKVYITEEALQAASAMSDRYLTGRQLPDKAIDILDTACARVATGLNMPPKQLKKLENERHQISVEIEHLVRDQTMDGKLDEEHVESLRNRLIDIEEEITVISSAWNMQKLLIDELIELRQEVLDGGEGKEKLHQLREELQELQSSQSLLHAEVGKDQIASIIADWTGIPLNTITGDELDRLTRLAEYLQESIKGQDDALQTIHRHLLTAMADLRREGRPLGAFLLVGPSGVGKTETAIKIADFIFGGREFMTTINMSEYQEKHTLSRLIGSPPGYVGFGEGGVLSEAIRQRPYSVVLLDEVEKAHPDVLNLFYQAFDRGEFADGEGRIINCRNIAFFLTSNLGFDRMDVDYDQLGEEALRKELMQFFKPALLARMQVVRYNFLSSETLDLIIDGRLKKLVTQFKDRYNAPLTISEGIEQGLKDRCIHQENGARMLDAAIEGDLLPPLSLAVLEHMVGKQAIQQAEVSLSEGAFLATVE